MSSSVCKATTTMSDSEESASSEASDVKAGRKYLKGMKGHDIFGEYDYSKHSEDQDTEASEMETDTESTCEEKKDQTKRRKVKRQIHGIDKREAPTETTKISLIKQWKVPCRRHLTLTLNQLRRRRMRN